MRKASRWASSAKRAVQAYQFTRGDQDAYAIETLNRARKAITEGAFKAEIVPVSVPAKGGTQSIENDEHAMKVRRRRFRP